MVKYQKPIPKTHAPTNNYPRHGMTLDEVARAFNITRERARQIEASALRKLRIALREKGITPELILPDWTNQ